MENIADLNIATLSRTYREAGPAHKGHRTIVRLQDSKEKGLGWLLRHHNEATVYSRELTQRFEIDALLQYYALLQVAITAGYIPRQLNETLKSEIIGVLTNPDVQTYCSKNYPFQLPSLLLYTVRDGIDFLANDTGTSKRLFNEFLLTNRLIEEDAEVTCFLRMLDYVSYNNEDIDSVIELLANRTKLAKVLSKPAETEGKEMAVWGFIKYADFLVKLKTVIQTADAEPKLQSVMWEYHSYWFRIMAAEMRGFFDQAFANLADAVQKTKTPAIFEQEDEESKLLYAAYQQQLAANIEISRQAVHFLLEHDYSVLITQHLVAIPFTRGLEKPVKALPKLKIRPRKKD
ncbi:hypothetical protein MKQ68_10190 [Chitinophaga horti]|uniref:Uncharacterized protein n=1 Tax=Chitinophaga horti TaxID=2920382 RepID=A0ABY6J715_9BACT|nr:hypothetical protein [Chitinophaga horti]UYQ95468.1 hypothetical protein MKQ68_10190 [Chitinophaga horti]